MNRRGHTCMYGTSNGTPNEMELTYQLSQGVTDDLVSDKRRGSHTRKVSEDDQSGDISLNEDPQNASLMVKRRRRKPIKSCAFCRQRKLRCDQKKPSCTTCLKRGREHCIYADNSTPDTSLSISQQVNEELLRKVSILECKLNEVQGYYGSNHKTKAHNILRDVSYFQCKENGRRTMFGPTAVRSFFMNDYWGLTKRYGQLWTKIKDERNKMKRETGYSMLGENALLEQPCDLKFNSEEDSTLINEFRRALPSYETIIKRIVMFFEDNELYVIYEAFDKIKVLKDFKESFIPSTVASPITNEREIAALIPSSKKNYYKIGVIAGILMYTSVHYSIPPAFEKFFVMLNGLSTGKTTYIERVQVTFLRYCFRAKWGLTGGDSPHTIMLVNSMVNEALLVGLNTNIEHNFKGQESIFGTLSSLRNLWLWILFCDVDSALQMGSLLKVSEELIFDESVFEIDKEDSESLLNLLGSFLKMARPMLLSVLDKNVTPDLRRYCEEVIQFTERRFPPIGCYTDKNLVAKTSLRTTIVLSAVISMLLAFYGLRILALKERTGSLENALGTTTLISFALSINLITQNYQRDKLIYPETLGGDFKNLSPYVCLTVSFLHRLIVRSLSIFYTIFYHKLTLFESGTLILHADANNLVDMNSLRVPSSGEMSLLSVFEKFSEIFESFTNTSDKIFNKLVRRSHILITTFALERLCHKVMDKVLESRRIAENTFMLQYQHEIEASNVSNQVKPTISTSDNSVSNKVQLSSNSAVLSTLSAEGNVGNLTGTIEDDFWTTYNVGWDEFLSSADNVDIYSDLMMKD